MHALDECAESEFEDLVKNVERQFSYNQKSYGKFKYLLTCRPYEQIVSSFGSLLSTFPYIRIPGEEESDAISREVDLVITHQVRLLARDKLLSLQIRNELEKGLQQATNRTYLWIYLIFDYLRKENFKKTQKAVMSIIMTLPKTVNEAYNQILTKSKDIIIARKALNIVLGASQPLTVPQMNIAVNIDSQSIHDLDLEDNKDFETRLRSSCGLFISIYRGKIYFLHQTAREFLVNTALPTELPVVTLPKLLWHRSISMRDAHAVLAEICVLYLNSLDGDLSLSTDAISDGNRALHDDDFLDYSASFWGAHFHEAKFEDGDTILPLALRICNPTSKSFSKWFKLQSIHYEEGKKANPMRFTKLMVAAYFGHHVLVKLLLQQGADIEAKDDQDNNGWTPLLWASIKSHKTVMKLLLEKGADVNAKTHDSHTSLSSAVSMGLSIGIIRLLLKMGADTEMKDDEYGWTSLCWATVRGYRAIVQRLVENGADLTAKDNCDRTPLSYSTTRK
ncbi:ankyrin repeat-containing domain protein [Trichoderma asperelloides]|nr:ankyrin repeat-containing domain protein [Trichoderma asperelloides]